jgi:hypothetical protein
MVIKGRLEFKFNSWDFFCSMILVDNSVGRESDDSWRAIASGTVSIPAKIGWTFEVADVQSWISAGGASHPVSESTAHCPFKDKKRPIALLWAPLVTWPQFDYPDHPIRNTPYMFLVLTDRT